MKKLQISFLSFLCLITVNLKIFAQESLLQERLQSIGKGISLIGLGKEEIQSHLNNDGFKFTGQSQNGDMFKYSKQTLNSSYEITFAIKNNKVDAMQWYEHLSVLKRDLSEITQAGFKSDVVNNDEGIYSFKNYSRNLLISLLVHSDEYKFAITIGEINSDKAVVKSKKKNPIKTPEKYYTPKYSEENEHNLEPNKNFIVVAQKANFYDVTFKKKGFLVEGEKMEAVKERDFYVYCISINPHTKIVTKGWFLKNDLEIISVEHDASQINNIGSNSPYYSLLKLDNESNDGVTPDSKKIFNNPIIAKELKKIMGKDYLTFHKDFVSDPLLSEVHVRHNILYATSVAMHFAVDNATFFLDLKSGQSFLFWNKPDKNADISLKNYGNIPLSEGIVNFILLYKNNVIQLNSGIDENELQQLVEIMNQNKSAPAIRTQ